MIPYYQDQMVTIYHGDNEDLVPYLDGVDHIFTDPPYGTQAAHSGHASTYALKGGDKAKPLGFEGISEARMVDLAASWVKLARRWVIFTCEWKYMSALDRAGLLVRFGVWVKPNPTPQFSGDRPAQGFEAVAVCHREGRKSWNGGGRPAVWTVPKPTHGRSGHPTEKPIDLVRAWIRDFTSPGDLILDPFAGSGTVGAAAKEYGRKAILIERDPKWCAVAARRCSQEVLAIPGEYQAEVF